MVVDSSDRVLVAGYDDSSAGYLARHLRDGNLDPTFGTLGVVRDDFGGEAEFLNVLQQPDGKILAAGTVNYWNPVAAQFQRDLLLARYQADGSLDSSFGTGGVFRQFVANLGWEQSLAWQPDGRILVAGEIRNGSNDDIALFRIAENGVLDSSFGSAGIVTTDFGANDNAKQVAVRADGKIVVAAEIYDNTIEKWAVALLRYQSDGSLDPTFGESNGVTLSSFTHADGPKAMAFQQRDMGTDDPVAILNLRGQAPDLQMPDITGAVDLAIEKDLLPFFCPARQEQDQGDLLAVAGKEGKINPVFMEADPQGQGDTRAKGQGRSFFHLI
jgi:uncharacterized delta-60 repeat protein